MTDRDRDRVPDESPERPSYIPPPVVPGPFAHPERTYDYAQGRAAHGAEPVGFTPPGRSEDGKKRSKLPWIIIGLLLLVFCLIGVVLIGSSASKKEPAAPNPAVSVPANKPVAPKALATRVGVGTYKAGEQIQAGTYKVVEKANGDCYYDVQAGKGNFVDQGVGGGFPEFKVANGQSVTITSCPDFQRTGK